jgi:meckelin
LHLFLKQHIVPVNIAESTVLRYTSLTRFALAALVYLVVGFGQWFLNIIIVERILVDHFRNFMDLCSMSNISVLALTHSHYGYYIHGRSVHGFSDANMKQMNEMLQRERVTLF